MNTLLLSLPIERKRLNSKRLQPCLVIDLGGGIKAQYPMNDRREAAKLYETYKHKHQHLDIAATKHTLPNNQLTERP